jgi:hypothetical protein
MSVVWLLVGAALGVVNGLILQQTVDRLSPETSANAVLGIMGGTAVRWGLIAGLLIVALHQGAVAGLLAFAGLWLSRWATVIWWHVRRE